MRPRLPVKSTRRPKRPSAAKISTGTHAAVIHRGELDSIDRIVTQWRRERPDLDPTPMRLFGLLAHAHVLTTPYLNDVLAEFGLSRGTFDVLSALRRTGLPFALTPKQLSDSLMLSGAGMTSRLDRLESLALVVRVPEPNDRRSLKIQLTPKGRRLIDNVIPRVIDAHWQLVSKLGDDQAKALIDLLGKLVAIFRSPA